MTDTNSAAERTDERTGQATDQATGQAAGQADDRAPGASGRAPTQPSLPFEEPADTPGRENPIRYALTARARRVVAPSTLPDLEVLPGDAGRTDGQDGFDPHDTRPARARALRRAGRALAEIGALLDVDLELVARWCDEIHDVRTPRPRRRRPQPAERDDGRSSADDARRAAAREAFAQAVADTEFRTALGLVSGLANITSHAVLVSTGDLDTAAVVLEWIRATFAPDETRVRLVLDVPADLARDVVVDRWTSRLAIPAEHVTAASTGSLGPGEQSTAALRIADPDIAVTLAEWRRLLVDELGGGARRRGAAGSPTTGTE